MALVIAWIIGTSKLCKTPEGTVCDLSWYLLDILMGPVRFMSGKSMDLVFKLTGIVPGPLGSQTTHPRMDVLSVGIGLSLLLLYWFLLGGVVCVFWRIMRRRIKKAFA